MRSIILALSAASLVIPATMALPLSGAVAQDRRYNDDDRRYDDNHRGRDSRRRYEARVYKGRDGRTYCRHSDGTTGLIVGGVGGALLGNSVAGRGDKTLGTVLGGVAGAFGGRAIDRASTADRRCR